LRKKVRIWRKKGKYLKNVTSAESSLTKQKRPVRKEARFTELGEETSVRGEIFFSGSGKE